MKTRKLLLSVLLVCACMNSLVAKDGNNAPVSPAAIDEQVVAVNNDIPTNCTNSDTESSSPLCELVGDKNGLRAALLEKLSGIHSRLAHKARSFASKSLILNFIRNASDELREADHEALTGAIEYAFRALIVGADADMAEQGVAPWGLLIDDCAWRGRVTQPAEFADFVRARRLFYEQEHPQRAKFDKAFNKTLAVLGTIAAGLVVKNYVCGMGYCG